MLDLFWPTYEYRAAPHELPQGDALCPAAYLHIASDYTESPYPFGAFEPTDLSTTSNFLVVQHEDDEFNAFIVAAACKYCQEIIQPELEKYRGAASTEDQRFDVRSKFTRDAFATYAIQLGRAAQDGVDVGLDNSALKDILKAGANAEK